MEQRDASAPVQSILTVHSNENLLKIETYDKFSTVGAIKKYIIKALPPPITGEPPEKLFPGLLRIGKNPKNPHIFLAFETPEDRENAMKHLITVTFRRKAWAALEVTEHELQLQYKGQKANDMKRPRDTQSKHETPNSVSKWETMPLEQQIEQKTNHCQTVMKVLLPTNKYGWNTYHERFHGVYSCSKTEHYRNHVNFSFGVDDQGRPTLGFMKGCIVDGETRVLPVGDREKPVVTTHQLAVEVAIAVQSVLDHFSSAANGALSVHVKATGKGFWRRLQVRHNILGEMMLDFQVDQHSIPETIFSTVLDSLRTALTNPVFTQQLKDVSQLSTACVVSLQYHAHSGSASLPQVVERVVFYGTPTLLEYLCQLKFELSPPAFFQVNTPGMELMLSHLKSAASLNSKTILLDLCSGTGTIGLALAGHVSHVYGIELVPEAVENARKNAEMNNIRNTTFIAGRLENLLPGVINRLKPEELENVVAILDPPRAGVSSTVVKWIRSTPQIGKVIYISCEQQALQRDIPGFMKDATKAYRYAPFTLESGFGVDLFPHTPHVEMVVVLSREMQAHGPEIPDSE